MCTFFLIRHAAHSGPSDSLPGRLPGISLSEKGRTQAQALAAQLSPTPLAAIHSSPRQRTLETAWPLAEAQGLNVSICDALDELDYGDWSGANLASLKTDPDWQRWNDERSNASPPHGESMRAAQARIVAHLESVADEHPIGTFAIITHAELVRAALLHVQGLPLDAWRRFDIPLAGVTRLRIGRHGWERTSLQGAQAA